MPLLPRTAASLLTLTFLLPAPAFAVRAEDNCALLSGTLQRRCERRQERLQDGMRGSAPTLQEVRSRSLRELQQQRTRTRQRMDTSVPQQSTAPSLNRLQQRLQDFRSRYYNNRDVDYQGRTELRRTARRLHDRAQERRERIRDLHQACSDVPGQRQQCLNEQYRRLR